MTDRERRSWPDTRLNEMFRQVQDNRKAVQELLEVAEERSGVLDLIQAQRDMLEFQASRITTLREEIRRMARAQEEWRRETTARFDRIDDAHDRTEKRAKGVDPDTEEPLPPAFRPDFRFWMKLIGAVAGASLTAAVPLAVAILGSS